MKYLALVFLVLFASTQATRDFTVEDGQIEFWDVSYLTECYNDVVYVDGPSAGVDAALANYSLWAYDDITVEGGYWEFELEVLQNADESYYLEYASFFEAFNNDGEDYDYLGIWVYEDVEVEGNFYFNFYYYCAEDDLEIDAEALIPESSNPYDGWVKFAVDFNSMGDGFLRLYIDGLEVYSEEEFDEEFEESFDTVVLGDVYPYPSEDEVAISYDVNSLSVPEDHECFQDYLNAVLLQKHHKKAHHKRHPKHHKKAHHEKVHHKKASPKRHPRHHHRK